MVCFEVIVIGDREVSWRVGDQRSGEGRGEWSKSEQVGNIPTEHSRGEAWARTPTGSSSDLSACTPTFLGWVGSAVELIAHHLGWAGWCLVRWLEMGTGQDESESGSGPTRAG